MYTFGVGKRNSTDKHGLIYYKIELILLESFVNVLHIIHRFMLKPSEREPTDSGPKCD